MHWIYLAIAIATEVAGTTCMKLSEGFTKPAPSLFVAMFYGVSFYCLSLCLKKVDVSVAYAIWSGAGTAVIASIGIVFFREPVGVLKLIGLAAIIAGVITLNLSGAAH